VFISRSAFFVVETRVTMIMPTIMKFGGTSVGDAGSFENVAQIVRGQLRNVPIVVVSALSGVTDKLLASTNIERAQGADPAIRSLTPTFERHKETGKGLLSKSAAKAYSEHVDEASKHIADYLKLITLRPKQLRAIQDSVLAFGETLSSLLMADVLN